MFFKLYASAIDKDDKLQLFKLTTLDGYNKNHSNYLR